MTHMKPLVALLVAIIAGVALAYALPAAAFPAQNACVAETHACSSGSCSRPIPDGGVGADAGVSLAFVQAYTVRVCGTEARPLAGAGSLKNYHCEPSKGRCSIITANTQNVTHSGGPPYCEEFPGFTLPHTYPSSDKMVWASSGVTISNWDGGVADTVTVHVCPAQ